MSSLRFSWDQRKAATNKRKHGVDFDEAKSVFYDGNAIQFFDDEYEDGEDRFLLIGMSAHLRVLIVVHAVRDAGQQEIIRIISARPATTREKQRYHEA